MPLHPCRTLRQALLQKRAPPTCRMRRLLDRRKAWDERAAHRLHNGI